MSICLMVRKDVSKTLHLVTVLRHHGNFSNSYSYENALRTPLGRRDWAFKSAK